jgi:outer membrane protein TolC
MCRILALWSIIVGCCAGAAAAQIPQSPIPNPQSPSPMEAITLDEAVQRALKNNPTVAQAAQGVLRAEALLQQARAVTLPSVAATFTNATIDTERGFNGAVTQPQSQSALSANIGMPILALSRWAAAAQAGDQVEVARLSTADIRTEIAIATAQAYLAVIALKRQVDVNVRARETALAHLDYAQRRLQAGAGTRLNELRAAQEVSTDEARLETAQLGVRRAQEALGVLVVAEGPIDAAGDPVFDVSQALEPIDRGSPLLAARPDVQFSAATARAAERVWRDSYKDYFPTGTVSFDPQALMPSGAFTSARSWRLTVMFSQPVFDGWFRRGQSRFREAEFNTSRLALEGLEIQARSEVRVAQETVRSSERVLTSLRAAAQQAGGVLEIVNIAFEAGATTNLEVIDAQRQARDADTAAAVAENALWRAKLDLLASLGRFP